MSPDANCTGTAGVAAVVVSSLAVADEDAILQRHGQAGCAALEGGQPGREKAGRKPWCGGAVSWLRCGILWPFFWSNAR